MEIRNPKCCAEPGLIDCEVHHPVLGWVMFTLTPDDQSENATMIRAALEGMEIAPHETAEDQQEPGIDE